MYRVVTPPTSEPVSLDEVKTALRLTSDTTEDTLLTRWITAAREHCENHMGRALATQTIELALDDWPRYSHIALPMVPIQSVTSVKYLDYTGAETTMLLTTQYLVDIDNGRIVLPYSVSWPSFTAYPVNPIRIRYVAGYTAPPEPLRQAIILIVGHWNENREDAVDVVGGKIETIPFSAKSLMAQYKERWFG